MSNTKSTDTKAPRVAVAFAALDPYLETVGVAPTEKKARGDRIAWGDRDRYPDYILELYNNVPTLQSIINGTVDFIAGDDIILDPAVPRFPGFYPAEVVRDLAHDMETYGGFAIQVVRDLAGRPSRIYHLDLRHVRSNKDNTVFYYCENWQKSGSECVTYPAFMALSPETWATLDEEARNRQASSVYFFKAIHTQTYPAPPFAAAVKDCEIERRTTDYHLNSLENGFTVSTVVNFNNGTPDDKIKEEIERDFIEKFAGNQNAGRIMFSFNKSKENATTFEYPKVDDFGEKYKALSTHSRQQIFASFRAVPALFGIMTESTGFNEQEFEQAFRLYNRTRVRPAQRVIADAFEQIYGIPGALTIKPFTLDGADTNVD